MDPRSTHDRTASPPPHLPGTPPPGQQRQQHQGGSTQDWASQQNHPQGGAPEFRSPNEPTPFVRGSPERSNASVIILDRPHSDGGHQMFTDRMHPIRRTSRAPSAINPLPPWPQEDGHMDGRMPALPRPTRTVDTLTTTGRRSVFDGTFPVDEKVCNTSLRRDWTGFYLPHVGSHHSTEHRE